MKQLTYVLHFRGQSSRSGDGKTALRTSSIGTSCTINTVIGPEGLATRLDATAGDVAFFEADMQLQPPDAFTGHGTITFGDGGDHALEFRSQFPGHLAPGTEDGVMVGCVSWRIEGGSGQFAGATGFISSTFTLTESGDLNDYHCGLILLPE